MRLKLWLSSLVLLLIIGTGFINSAQKDDISGAWHRQNANSEHVLLFIDGYFTHSTYDKTNKKFIQTRGGTYQLNNNQVTVNIEFDTKEKDRIGKPETFTTTVNGNKLTANIEAGNDWSRIDNGQASLAGVWRITGRMQEGKVVPIQQRGPRKTLKILTGNRFQWAAINPETKEFFGTGGGTYTFANGKYTEQIEFFSRDSSRVGASLQFDGQLKDGDWHHSGLSSKGDKIYEVWSRVK